MTALTYEVIEHTWIPMPDGVRLSARLWLPTTADPVPAVLEYIPYRKRDLYRGADDAWGHVLATAGFAFARVDVRGTGESEGVIDDEYSEQEIADGVAIIAWLSQQQWCSGTVGMRGISWGAINSLLIAARQPPALRAIVAMAGADDRQTDDAHFIGGTVAHTGFQWGTMFKGVLAAPPDPQIVGPRWRDMWLQRLQATPAMLARWLARRADRDYWRALDTSAVKTPTYLVAGWQDTYANPILRILAALLQHAVPTKAMVGPWGHTTPQFARPTGLDWRTEELAWWSHWLRDEPNDVMAGPPLQCFMPYGTASQFDGGPIPGRWIAESSWPGPHSHDTTWFIGPGSLELVEPTATGATFTIDTGVHVGQCKPEWLDRAPLEQSHDDALSVNFDSPPLAEASEILGSVQLQWRVSPGQRQNQVAVRLCDIDAEGRSWLVATAVQRIAPIAGATGESEPEYRHMTLTFPNVAHHFAAGHRLRLACSSTLWPLVWPDAGADALRVQLDDARLVLPTRPRESEAHALSVAVRDRTPEPLAQYKPVAADVDGLLTLNNDEPERVTDIAETSTNISRSKSERSAVLLNDAGTATWRQASSTSFIRDDWHCTVHVGYELHTDDTHFHLREWVRAEDDSAVIHDQEDETLIPISDADDSTT